MADRRRRAGTSGPRSSGTTDDAPQFLGDLPHTWVGSDFVRSVLDMLAYERERTMRSCSAPACGRMAGG